MNIFLNILKILFYPHFSGLKLMLSGSFNALSTGETFIPNSQKSLGLTV
jgi:hypothetical protein